jgi:hypothetical protein
LHADPNLISCSAWLHVPTCSAGIAVPWRPDFENLAEEDMGSTVGNGTARYLNIKRDEVKAWVQAVSHVQQP